MQCQVCGMEYARSHNCPGTAPALSPEEALPAPEGFAPFHYLRLGFEIARWDDVAIRRASRDPNALPYGVVYSAMSATIIFLVTALPKMLTRQAATGGTIFWGLLLGLVFVWVYTSAIALIQCGFCHLIARWFLGATGTFFGVIRPLLLGWFVNCLILIPRNRHIRSRYRLDRRADDGFQGSGRYWPPSGIPSLSRNQLRFPVVRIAPAALGTFAKRDGLCQFPPPKSLDILTPLVA